MESGLAQFLGQRFEQQRQIVGHTGSGEAKRQRIVRACGIVVHTVRAPHARAFEPLLERLTRVRARAAREHFRDDDRQHRTVRREGRPGVEHAAHVHRRRIGRWDVTPRDPVR